jgi:hypothetical protein
VTGVQTCALPIYSFLSRFQMKRDADVLVLEKRF